MQYEDAVVAYTRYLELVKFGDELTIAHCEHLQQVRTKNETSTKEPLQMRDIDLRGNMKQPDRIDHEEDINLPGLESLVDSDDDDDDYNSEWIPDPIASRVL